MEFHGRQSALSYRSESFTDRNKRMNELCTPYAAHVRLDTRGWVATRSTHSQNSKKLLLDLHNNEDVIVCLVPLMSITCWFFSLNNLSKPAKTPRASKDDDILETP